MLVGSIQLGVGMVLVLWAVFRTHAAGVYWVWQERIASILYLGGVVLIIAGAWNARAPG